MNICTQLPLQKGGWIQETISLFSPERKLRCKLNALFSIFTAVDHCVMYRGWYGVNLVCPPGYIATGACAGGKTNDCGVGASTRLKCCKINVASTSQTCSPVATTSNGKDITCPKTDGRLTLVTEYCGSGQTNDCAGNALH